MVENLSSSEKKSKTRTANAHSQAHLQFAQADTGTKNCKRAYLFSYAFLPTRKTKSGQCLN